jgi:hypothetical protein
MPDEPMPEELPAWAVELMKRVRRCEMAAGFTPDGDIQLKLDRVALIRKAQCEEERGVAPRAAAARAWEEG